MTTLLTWEPRRIRVLLTRAVVVLLVAFVITVGLQAIFSAVFWLGASTRGTTAFSPSGVWSDVGLTMLRTSVVGTGFALIALSIAMIGRSTVSSLGALFGYLILFEGVIAGFRPSIQGWLLVRAGIVVVSQTPIYGYGRNFSYASSTEPNILMSVARADAVVGVYVLVLLVLALVVFRRRDVS
jgi:ABC-2 type transport system permease protein